MGPQCRRFRILITSTCQIHLPGPSLTPDDVAVVIDDSASVIMAR